MDNCKCKASCFDCQHAQIDPGYQGDMYEPPSEAVAYCQDNKYDPSTYPCDGEYYDSDDIDVQKCPGFKPHLINKCENCGIILQVPRYNWPYMVMHYAEEYVCSQKCQDEYQEKINKEIDESIKSEERLRNGEVEL